ncbi:hypothetical protein CVN76_21680 [Bacillus sp. mrc49]|nr:hypothetical protein CVN76_21680 [Bacillus sp. mrc49]
MERRARDSCGSASPGQTPQAQAPRRLPGPPAESERPQCNVTVNVQILQNPEQPTSKKQPINKKKPRNEIIPKL